MTSKSLFVMHVILWVATTTLWTAGAGAAGRYDTATPHTPPYAKHKYIPLHSSYGHDDPYDMDSEGHYEATTETSEYRMPPSEFLLTALRTALDVIRNINKNRAGKSSPATNTTIINPRKLRENNKTEVASGRGFDDYYDDHHYHDTTTTTAKPVKQGRYTDPWAGYYDWIINEGSFKFWSVFQLFTAALLLYACFSAIYYAKFNPIIPDYDREYDDYFLERSVGRQARSLDQWHPSELASGLSWINPRTFQFILDAISKHYDEE